MLELSTIILALGLPEDSTDRAVLGRITDLREAAGEDVDSLSEQEQLLAGKHDTCSLNEDGTVSVTLYTPLKLPHTTITELKFKRPTARVLQRAQMKRADGRERDNVEKTIRIFAELTGLAPAELEDLDMADMASCNLAFSFLSGPPRRTGTKS